MLQKPNRNRSTSNISPNGLDGNLFVFFRYVCQQFNETKKRKGVDRVACLFQLGYNLFERSYELTHMCPFCSELVDESSLPHHILSKHSEQRFVVSVLQYNFKFKKELQLCSSYYYYIISLHSLCIIFAKI
jgi:hypothetical protein